MYCRRHRVEHLSFGGRNKQTKNSLPEKVTGSKWKNSSTKKIVIIHCSAGNDQMTWTTMQKNWLPQKIIKVTKRKSYLCPVSCAMVKAVPRPPSLLKVQLPDRLHMPWIWARPLFQNKLDNFKVRLWNDVWIFSTRLYDCCYIACQWKERTSLT